MRSADKAIEVRARGVEAAIEKGLAELRLQRHEVDIEVLHPGSRGVLGIGAEDAVVRLTPRRRSPEATPPRPQAAEKAETRPPAQAQRPAAKEKPAVAVKASPEAAQPSAGSGVSLSDDEVADLARRLLHELLELLGISADVAASYSEPDGEEESTLLLDVIGKDLGVLIGRRGETLASLQFLMRLMVSNHAHGWVNVVVDIEGYKARRERMLRELALRMAERAVATGRVVALEAMPARERRIVHVTLRDHGGVTTQSTGEGENRKVTIIPN
jgi:spoIIIJ-associated protein